MPLTALRLISHVKASWREHANCRTYKTAIFYPLSGNTNAYAYTTARHICSNCPVQNTCLSEALDNREQYGMWGGCTPTERSDMLIGRGESPLASLNVSWKPRRSNTRQDGSPESETDCALSG